MEQILGQIRFSLAGLFLGIILRFLYDIILAFRLKKKTALARKLCEDIVFWLVASFFAFQGMLDYDQGILRGYCLSLCVFGIWLYQKVSSGHVVLALQRVFKMIFRPYVWFLEKFHKNHEKKEKKP